MVEQYVGFVRDGRIAIYGNFVPSPTRSQLESVNSLVVACDGGAYYWGVVYDPASDDSVNLRSTVARDA